MPREVTLAESPNLPRVLCLPCARADGRMPGPNVRAPRDVPPGATVLVASVFGKRRHAVVEWAYADGRVVRSATACGVRSENMGSQAEWSAQLGDRAPVLANLRVCAPCSHGAGLP